MKLLYCKISMLCILFFIAYPVLAEKKDTVSYFNGKKGCFHYTNPAIVSQFARFSLKKPSVLHAVTVTLVGKAGKGQLHFYGYEGGSSVPFLKQELIDPILIEKTQEGIQSVTVVLKDRPEYRQNQFFIGVDNLSEGVYLVTDRIRRKPQCISDDSKYYYQIIQFGDGRFEYGNFAYSVKIVTEALPSISPIFQADPSAFTPNTFTAKADYRNICVSDLNGDGFDDILVNGRLYMNHNGSFTDETRFKNLPELESRSITLDFNNDGRMDILSFLSEKDTLAGILYLNTVKGFVAKRLNVRNLRSITSLSVADVNADGFADVFVGQFGDDEAIRSKILMNSHGERLLDNSTANGLPALNYSRGSFLADLDADGRTELFVAGAKHQSNYLRTIGITTGLQSTSRGENEHLGAGGIGGMPSDMDGDGEQDIVFTIRRGLSSLKKGSVSDMEVTRSLTTIGDPLSASKFLPYLDRASGGVCADINNDGLTDIFLPTSCTCNSARMYLGSKEGFKDVTEEYGLTGITDARDAVFFDADNNGTLDLLVFSGGILRYYRNSGVGKGGYIRISLQDKIKNGNAGAQIITYTGGEKRNTFLVSGRGILMQDPTSVVIGIGDKEQVDSVITIWNTPERTIERFGPFKANTSNTLERGQGTPASVKSSPQCTTISDASAYPNPFVSETDIHFTLSRSSSVSVMIYTFTGVKYTEIFHGIMDSGSHALVWNGTDKSGNPASTGLYLYKITTDDCETIGQLHVQR